MIDYAYVIIHLFSTVFVVLVSCSVLASPFEVSYHLRFTVVVSISLTFSELDPCVKTSPEGHEVLDMVGQNIWDYGQRFAHEPFSINTHFSPVTSLVFTVFVALVTCSVLASPFEGSYHLLFTVTFRFAVCFRYPLVLYCLCSASFLPSPCESF